MSDTCEKGSPNRFGKKTKKFQNNAHSMIPLDEAQTLLKLNNILLRDARIAGGVRRTKKSRGILKIKCRTVVLSVGGQGDMNKEGRQEFQQQGHFLFVFEAHFNIIPKACVCVCVSVCMYPFKFCAFKLKEKRLHDKKCTL